jgi:tellurite resistance protein
MACFLPNSRCGVCAAGHHLRIDENAAFRPHQLAHAAIAASGFHAVAASSLEQQAKRAALERFDDPAMLSAEWRSWLQGVRSVAHQG